MKKTHIVCLVAIFLSFLYIIRVIYINMNTLSPILLSYNIGERVQIEDDYFNTSTEKMQGYAVSVLETELIPVDEFKEKYSNYQNKMSAEYIYILKVRFENENDENNINTGIDLEQYILQEASYICFIDRDAYKSINGFDTLKFSLKCHSQKEIFIPFHIDLNYIELEKLQGQNTQLVVSLYPHKKVIKLNL